MTLARWHDLECGAYDVDLPLWRELADSAGGPILDVGAGTGRVSIDLAQHGAEVTALDLQPELLEVLTQRAAAAGLDIPVITADAADFAHAVTPDPPFALVIVPMQTLQLLPGPDAREGFLRSARAVLAAGGVIACALADALECFDAEHTEPPAPDMREFDGVLYSSRPVAVRDLEDRIAIDRIRETVDRDGHRTALANTVVLARMDPEDFADTAVALGFEQLPMRTVRQTEEYVGSTVVMLRA